LKRDSSRNQPGGGGSQAKKKKGKDTGKSKNEKKKKSDPPPVETWSSDLKNLKRKVPGEKGSEKRRDCRVSRRCQEVNHKRRAGLENKEDFGGTGGSPVSKKEVHSSFMELSLGLKCQWGRAKGEINSGGDSLQNLCPETTDLGEVGQKKEFGGGVRVQRGAP